MGGRERAQNFVSFSEQDDDSSYLDCTKESMLHCQFHFSCSEAAISASDDGGNGTSAVLPRGRFGSWKAAVFTASQRQELERQTLVYKYIISFVPVPPQLLFPFLGTQSNTGLNLKNKAGLDLEGWRCKRTDGKKWRCSKDVLPDKKYCERHAHKNRPRSRKHVEIQSQISSGNQKTNTTPICHFHVPPSSDQTRSGGSTCSSSTLGLKSTHRSHYNDEHNILTSNQNPDGGGQELSDLFRYHNMIFPQGHLNTNHEIIQPAQHFFDGQSIRDKGKLDHGVESWSSSSIMPGGPLGEALGLGTSSNSPSPLLS
ncbi:unnamed protein product [Cuscuta epithymum]|uniref:Growth-regulating factor n=1 Tax=Cuscuta epithymum TaxID=186058 RepID=A0AAV0G0H6_9ASTE|nr:unnamed protein product [Cuscuta epithymum]